MSQDMARIQSDHCPIRVLPMNRRKVYLVSFAFTAAWYVVILTLASQPDTNCAVEDCDLWVTVLAWTLFAPLCLIPFACGLSLSPAGTPKRMVRWIISACTAGTGLVALIVFFWIDARNATPGGSVEANTRAFTAGLTFFGLPLCLVAGYLLVGLGGWMRRNRVSRS
jgi:hypothetical protein